MERQIPEWTSLRGHGLTAHVDVKAVHVGEEDPYTAPVADVPDQTTSVDMASHEGPESTVVSRQVRHQL